MENVFNKGRDPISLNSKNPKKEACPFVEDPFEDCYCFDMQSINVKQAIFFCQKKL